VRGRRGAQLNDCLTWRTLERCGAVLLRIASKRHRMNEDWVPKYMALGLGICTYSQFLLRGEFLVQEVTFICLSF